MKTIFVPSDFSENSTTALRYAIQLCNQIEGKLIVFHCLLPPIDLYSEGDTSVVTPSVKKEVEAVNKKLQQQVAETCESLGLSKLPFPVKTGADVNPLVVEKIIEVAAAEGADLIVVGTHGASGLNRFLFGTNTTNMMEKSWLPVLAIPPGHQFRKIERIVMASDLNDFKNELKQVLFFGAALQARIDILYLDYGIDPRGEKEQRAIQHMEKIPYKNMRFIKHKATIEETLIKQLKQCLAEQHPQWLAMFPRERKFWDKVLLHSKTESILASMKFPLLSIRKHTGASV